MSYLDFTLEELIYQYSPRESVPEHPVWKAHWTLFSEQAREQYICQLRVPYGQTSGQTLDIFPAHKPGSPINIFVHGGFWRFLDSFDHSLVAPAIIDSGGASILINYDLCPKVSLSEVIKQTRAALKWVWDNAERANGDRDKIYISGHSAGGHLTAMLCLTEPLVSLGLPRNVIKGATIVSAMLDLEPIVLVPGSEELHVTQEEIKALSPKHNPPDPSIDLVVAVGGRETSEWIRQTEDMMSVLEAQGSHTEFFKPDYDQHYSILFSLGNPRTPLCQAMLNQMKLSRASLKPQSGE
jgi:arylformamidase